MTKRRLWCGCSLISLLCAAASVAAEEAKMPGKVFYVATNGSDENPGTKGKPFATLERARDAIRELKKAGKLPKGRPRDANCGTQDED